MNDPVSGGGSPECVFVVFGIPGAGKTTVASLAFQKLVFERNSTTSSSHAAPNFIWLDLDCCIPERMKDNFARGVYPTLQERQDFARSACAHVKDQCDRNNATHALISFSFVNVDLRDAFRICFTNSTWILIDTSASTALERMRQRKNHFYKGNIPESPPTGTHSSFDEDRAAPSKADNSDWAFAPVTFPHTCLNGEDSAETNADRVVHIVRRALQSYCGDLESLCL